MTPDRRPLTLTMVVLALFGLASCGDDAAAPPWVSGPECRLVVVNSDYVSTSVSVLRSDGTLCADNILHSGSAPPGVTTALSGDVVAPTSAHPEGRITLIDRFPNGVITFVDPDTYAVHSQASVGTGFAANPHDVAFLGGGRAWVTRAETNPTPGAEPWDGGGDVVELNLESLTLTGRLDLNPQASVIDGQALHPRPDRFSALGGLLWLNLENLSGGALVAGAGTIVTLDPSVPLEQALLSVIRLPGLQDCTAHDPTPDGEGLWVSCTGPFAIGPEAQLAAAGLAFISAAGATPEVEHVVAAASLGDRPPAFGVEALSAERVIYATFGDLATGERDRLFVYDRGAGASTVVGTLDGAPYQLGPLRLVEETTLLLVPDADPIEPVLHRFAVGAGGALEPMPPVDVNPSVGLPPRGVWRFRQVGLR